MTSRGFPSFDLNWTRKFVTLHDATMDAVHELHQIGEHLRREIGIRSKPCQKLWCWKFLCWHLFTHFLGLRGQPRLIHKGKGCRRCSNRFCTNLLLSSGRALGSHYPEILRKHGNVQMLESISKITDLLLPKQLGLLDRLLRGRFDEKFPDRSIIFPFTGIRKVAWGERYVSNILKPYSCSSKFNQASLAARER